MTIDDQYKDIIIDALNSYYSNLISMIVSKEKVGDTQHSLRQLKKSVGELLRQLETES